MSVVERVWVFDELAVSVAVIDFLDPALRREPGARERGVRVELRPALASRSGSVYASDPTTLGAGICRIDFLESAPGAADRMHWHPEMRDGEPGERTFDPAMAQDTLGWLTGFLGGLDDYLACRDLLTAGRQDDVGAIRSATPEIAAAVADGLTRARAPWPEVEHDERGMAG